jgi:hypothetical protein
MPKQVRHDALVCVGKCYNRKGTQFAFPFSYKAIVSVLVHSYCTFDKDRGFVVEYLYETACDLV